MGIFIEGYNFDIHYKSKKASSSFSDKLECMIKGSK
jgi:hypothetical protein